MRRFQSLAVALGLGLVPAAGLAQTVSPSLGQDSAQQSRDKSECAAVARRLAEPLPGPTTTVQAPTPGAGTGGAAAGAAVAGSGGNVAGAGTSTGTLALRSPRSREAERQSGETTYDQAWADCLSNRGYTVK
jgi:hypothetical protein